LNIQQGERTTAHNKKLKIWYTNADTLTNKMSELRSRIHQTKSEPDVIAITEVKPKNARYNLTESEIKIDGYDICSNIQSPHGRGIAIYTKISLHSSETTMSTKYQESLWLKIKLKEGDHLLIGCIYRSPNSSRPNNGALRELLKEAAERDITHTLIVGDFNYPRIDWLRWTTPGEDVTTDEYRFIEAIRDTYLHQHVSEPTRGRGTDHPTLLDLIFTNEEGMINRVDHKSPLGKSDHAVLDLEYNCYTERQSSTRRRFFYDKGNYEEMRKEFTEDWYKQLEELESVEEKWQHFVKKLKTKELIHVPNKLVDKLADRKKFKTTLDNKTIEAVKKKDRCWRRYMETNDAGKHREYRKKRNQVRAMTRKIQKETEKGIARDAKKNPKKFWRYVKNKLKTRTGISDLETEDGLAKTDEAKAETLSKFFASVYTKETQGDIPTLERREYDQELEEVLVSEGEVLKKLNKLKIDKSPGPDGLHPRLLKELKE